MKGLRKCNVKFYSLSLAALLAVFFGSFIINQNNVSAVSDVVYNIDNATINSSNEYYICNNSSSTLPHCSDYEGVSIVVNTDTSFNTNISGDYGSFGFDLYASSNGINSSYTHRVNPSYINPAIFAFTSIVTRAYFPWQGLQKYLSNYDSSTTVTVTLLAELNSCPEPEPCPEVPEIPEYPYTEPLEQIKQAIIFVPAVALVIYFFYAIYKMLLGGKTL